MDEEEKLKKITKLLEQGCTMLAAHHDCGAPLFRCKGEVLCPVCSCGALEYDGKRPEEKGSSISAKTDENFIDDKVDVTGTASSRDLSSVAADQNQARLLREDERSRQESPYGRSAKPDRVLGSSLNDGKLIMAKQAVGETILMRLIDLTSAIKEEKDLGRLRSQLDCVEAAMRVLSSLKYEM